jgi:D-ribose pyranose/furanose isomerase RbsD
LLRFTLSKIIYPLGANSMRTFTANILVISAEIKDTLITGTAIDSDIAINFSVANNDVNQRLFIPEAQLVVTGKFRIAKAIATIGVWISGIMAVVSLPAPAEIEVEAIEPEAIVEVVALAEVIETEAVIEAVALAEVIEDEAIVEVIETAPLTPAQKRAATKAAKKAAAVC